MNKEKLEREIWKILVEGNGGEGEAVLKFISLCSLIDFKKLKDMMEEIDKAKV